MTGGHVQVANLSQAILGVAGVTNLLEILSVLRPGVAACHLRVPGEVIARRLSECPSSGLTCGSRYSAEAASWWICAILIDRAG